MKIKLSEQKLYLPNNANSISLMQYSAEEWKKIKNSYPIFTGIDENGEPVANWKYVHFSLQSEKGNWYIIQTAVEVLEDGKSRYITLSFSISDWENNIPEEVLSEICFEIDNIDMDKESIELYYQDEKIDFEFENDGAEYPYTLEEYSNFGKYVFNRIVQFHKGKPYMLRKGERITGNSFYSLDNDFIEFRFDEVEF